jgi:multidrug resistance efflux pump
VDTDNRQIVSQESETKRNKPVLVILILMAITLALVSYYYWNQNRNYVITDDARVDGNIIKVSPQVTGKIVEIAAEKNSTLTKTTSLPGNLTPLWLTAAILT